ncbi:MAG: histidine kinase [Nitrospira bacterium SG8_3]|nr:MAG: histidine kinase [Nitrospira bacterium SG8_3]
MSSIAIFSGTFCHGEEVVRGVTASLGCELVLDQHVTSEASRRFQISEEKFEYALSGETSLFKRFSREKERCIALLKLVLADMLNQDKHLFFGYATHLIPREITHVLKVGLIAERTYRTKVARDEKGLQEKDAAKIMRKEDEKAVSWVNYLLQKNSWDVDLYDIIVPMDKKSVESAVQLILENAQKDVVKITTESKRAVKDFTLAAEVESVLSKEGHHVSVSAKEGHVTLTIKKHVLLLSRLEEELKKITIALPGVKDVETRVGPGYYKSNIYRQFDVKKPSKFMLVDDEPEFVETLSDRLLMRDMPATIVYDGEQALSLVDQEEPEVMVLDLKMPGIDGMEVLRRIKKEHPHVEIIVLTGQGSKEDEELCLKLGAFAYLEKPVDVEVLAQTMREAYQKVRERS